METIKDKQTEALINYIENFGEKVKPEGMVKHFEYLMLWEAYKALKTENEALKNARAESGEERE